MVPADIQWGGARQAGASAHRHREFRRRQRGRGGRAHASRDHDDLRPCPALRIPQAR